MENYDGLKQFFLVDTLLKAARQSTSGSNSQRSADMDNPFREYASSTSLLSYLRTSFIDRPYMTTLLCCHGWHLITLGANQTVEGFNSTQINLTSRVNDIFSRQIFPLFSCGQGDTAS